MDSAQSKSDAAPSLASDELGDDEALRRQLADKSRALEELNETAAAFKLLNEKQTAELNAKDLLLARKNERIEELLAQLKDRDQLVESKDRAMDHLTEKIRDLEAETQDLRDQLATEEEEFSMLSAAMDATEQHFAKKVDEVAVLKDVESQLRKEVDRLQVQMRKLEKQVDDLHPQTMDACLSPRSFSENQLIQLRDDAINAKTKEIWLLTGQNDQLRIQLDELEAELERLQTSFVGKENDVARRDRKIEKLEAEIEALEVCRQQAEGRERAIEIATTQNTKLLQALQAQEVQVEELKTSLEQAERECRQLRILYHQHLEKSAVNEVEVVHRTKEAEQKSSAVSALQEKLVRERKALHEELAQERMKAQLEVEKLQSELVMRRNKQYDLTLRLQDVEAKLHQATDELESVNERFLATQARMEEAERVLKDSLTWKAALEDDLTRCRAEMHRQKRSLEYQIKEREAETAALRAQLSELKESLLKSLDQEKKKEFRIQETKRAMDAKDQLLTEQKDRIARLVQEMAKNAQARAELELEKGIAAGQLEKVRSQMNEALRECMEQHRRVESKWKAATEKQRLLEDECAKAMRGKSRLVVLFVQAYAAAATCAQHTPSTCLDLRECWLADADALTVLKMLESNAVVRKGLTRVDLRGNEFTQECCRPLAQFLKKSFQQSGGQLPLASSLREVDLRGNFISLDGMRIVANALESLVSPDGSQDAPVAKVIVACGGRIESYPDAQISNNEIPLLSVDMTENADPGQLPSVILKTQKLLVRRRRESDDCSAVARASVDPDPVLQAIYGVDLVATFMSDSKAQLNPPGGSLRRKSKDRANTPSKADADSSSAFGLFPSQSTLLEVPTLYSSPRTPSLTPRSRSSSSGPTILAASASLPRL